MAPKKGARVGGGGFLDLDLLIEANGGKPVTACFRIVEFEPATPGKFGVILPVIADVLISSGPASGEVHPAQRFLGRAQTAPLRGVPHPKEKGDPIPDPVELIGAELVFNITAKPGTGNPYVALDVPSDADFAAFEIVYSDGKAWDVEPASGAAEDVAPAARKPF